jgi:sugar phosphate permease
MSIGRTFMGIGSAFAFLSCVKIASLYFNPRILSILGGMTLSLGTVGATLGDAPLGFIVKLYDWRVANYILAGISILIAFAAWFLIEERTTPHTSSARKTSDTQSASDPTDSQSDTQSASASADSQSTEQKQSKSFLEGLLSILRRPQAWIYGGYGFAMYVPLSGFADLWGTPFLSETYHIEATQAAGIKSFFYIGLGVGAPLWSFYMTRLRSYKKGLFQSALAGTLIMSTALYIPMPLALMSPLLFISGFSVAGQFAAFAAAASLNSPSETATSSGLHNMMCMMSGIVMQPLIGFILDNCKAGDALCSAHYTVDHFLKALFIIPISLSIAVIFSLFMKESFPRDA